MPNYNPNRDISYRLNKLIKNYDKHKSIVIGVDFDFTIKDAVTGQIYTDIIELLQKGQELPGVIYCIWTANAKSAEVKQVWIDYKLNWHYYNKSPINLGEIKPHFNLLLDDSAGLDEAMKLFSLFIDNIKMRNSNEIHFSSNSN